MTAIEELSFWGPGLRRRSSDVVHVGLVNNMPDAAIRATELQFARLLRDASTTVDIRLHLFSFPEIARSETMRSRMEGFYGDASTIPQAQIDALIITGAEPRMADLREEPYWESFTRLTDWAKSGTVSAVFSCLAAHAAVFHLDGVARHLLPEKLSGVFDCEQVTDEPLSFGAGLTTAVPQSRYNELREDELEASGYRILSRIQGGGVNSFARDVGSQFVFLQGHPEYDRNTLGREYCRDAGRYLRGERDGLPKMPENYFDLATIVLLEELIGQGRDPALLDRYSEIVANAVPMRAWRGDSVCLFGNWLALIAAKKAQHRARDFPQTSRNLRRA
jgi:homoserine O-succinyltransferase